MTVRPQQIIRIAETNIDGTKPVNVAIRRIRGVSFMLSNAIAKSLKLEGKKLGELSEEEQKKLENVITNLDKLNLPAWMLNRRKDLETGSSSHIVASKLQFTQKMDINLMRKLKTYKGVRHAGGLPVRGQRTRSSFRRGAIVGVKRKQLPAKAANEKK
jgi:small subunit ribosomal protein S13